MRTLGLAGVALALAAAAAGVGALLAPATAELATTGAAAEREARPDPSPRRPFREAPSATTPARDRALLEAGDVAAAAPTWAPVAGEPAARSPELRPREAAASAPLPSGRPRVARTLVPLDARGGDANGSAPAVPATTRARGTGGAGGGAGSVEAGAPAGAFVTSGGVAIGAGAPATGESPLPRGPGDDGNGGPAPGSNPEPGGEQGRDREPEPRPDEDDQEIPADGDDDAVPRGPTRVRLALTGKRLQPGGELVVRVLIDNAREIGSVPFHLRFDPAVLRFQRGAQGPFLGSDGQSAVAMAAALSSGDVVVVGATRLGAVPGISGSGELCRLHFEIVGAGATPLAFSEASVRGPAGEMLEALFEPAAVEVAER